MPEAGEAPVQAKVEARHVAATLLEGIPRANISSTEVRDMMDFKQKHGSEAGFRRETALSEADSSFVNFEDLQKTIDTEPNGPRKDMLQKKKDAYEKLLNDNENNLTADEAQEIRKVIANLPGFCEAMAAEISVGYGTAFTATDIKDFLVPDPTSRPMRLTAQDFSKIVHALEKFVKDPQFKKVLKSNLGKITLPDDDAVIEGEISKFTTEIAKEPALTTRKGQLDIDITNYETAHDANERRTLNDTKKQIESIIGSVEPAFKPLNFASIASSITALDAQIAATAAQLNGATGNWQQALQDRQARYNEQKNSLIQARLLFTANSTALSEFETYLKNQTEMKDVDTKLTDIQQKKTELKIKENKRSKYMNKNKAGLENALDHAVTTHWNQNLLRNAEQSAFEEAKNKAETKGEKQDMAKFILEKYLRLHLLEYEANGHAKGWNKTKIKLYRDLLLSKSPAEMMRTMVGNIYTDIATMPQTYQDELKAELKKIGIETPAQFTDYVANLDTKFLYSIAPENVAVTLGYSLASGNWITREKFGKAEIEFLQINYGKDFWQKAFANQEQYQHVADAHGLGTLKLGDAFGRSFDKLLQKNPGEFFGKLFKILAILGLLALLGFGISKVIPH